MHLLSTYLLASILSKALATISYSSKKLSVKIFYVLSQTFSWQATICILSLLFILITAVAAVNDFGFLMCSFLNKNCLFKLEFSIWSGSVNVNYPFFKFFSKFSSPTQREIIAKFFNNSHPIAPLPTINSFTCYSFSDSSSPITIFN